MTREDDAQVPAFAPDPADVPQDETSRSPLGKLRGGAVDTLLKIAQARLTPGAKDVLMILFEATYAQTVMEPDRWGWVRVDQHALADYLHTWPSEISERLNLLMKLHILHRPGRRMIVCLRPWQEWDVSVWDFEAAKKRATKSGAGAPAAVREPHPDIPLSERIRDIRDQDFITQDVIAAHVREWHGDEEAVAAHWRVVERFQSLFDQRFRPEWFEQLTTLLAQHSSTTLIFTMTRIAGKYHPPKPWGYLIACLDKTPKRGATADETFNAPGRRPSRKVGQSRDVGRSEPADSAVAARVVTFGEAASAPAHDEHDASKRGPLASATGTRRGS